MGFATVTEPPAKTGRLFPDECMSRIEELQAENARLRAQIAAAIAERDDTLEALGGFAESAVKWARECEKSEHECAELRQQIRLLADIIESADEQKDRLLIAAEDARTARECLISSA